MAWHRSLTHWSYLKVAVWTQPKEEQLVQTLWMRSESAIMLRSYSAPREFSWWCLRPYGAVTATSLRFYYRLIITQSHSTHFLHIQVCAVAWRSIMFKAISTRQMKMPLHCYRTVGDSTACTLAIYIISVRTQFQCDRGLNT